MTNTEIPLQLITDALDFANTEGFEIRNDYSGRGMYGVTCFGIVFDRSRDAFRFFAALGTLAASIDAVDDDAVDSDLAVSLAQRASEDSMGRGMIIYFPGYSLDREPEGDAFFAGLGRS